jgi:methylaspartate mutase sigma subunit
LDQISKRRGRVEEKLPTLIIGMIGADVHTVGSKVLQYALTEAGFKVIHLGVMVSPEEFIKAAIETDAKAILISSLYGHAEIDCQGFRDKCVEAGLKDILLYVGGNLVVGSQESQDFVGVEKKFLAMGFDRVFSQKVQLEEAIRTLKEDLKAKNLI